MYKGIIFDLDGTLLDTLESISYSANRALIKCGLKPHPKECYKNFAGDGQENLILRSLHAAGDTRFKLYEDVMKEYRSLFVEDCTYKVKPYDGIVDLLESAKSQGLKLAVLSNKADANVRYIIDTVFGKDKIDYVLGAKSTYARKPSREGIDIVLDQLHLKVDECIYVGDTDTDMLTGRGAGIFTIGVTWGFRDERELKEGGADVIVSHPQDIIKFLN